MKSATAQFGQICQITFQSFCRSPSQHVIACFANPANQVCVFTSLGHQVQMSVNFFCADFRSVTRVDFQAVEQIGLHGTPFGRDSS